MPYKDKSAERAYKLAHKAQYYGYVQKWRRNHRDKVRAWDKKRTRTGYCRTDSYRTRQRLYKQKYRKTVAGKQAMRRASLKSKTDPNYKLKRACKRAVSKAVARGVLVRGNCEACGNPKTHGHHDDYSRPLQVRWLCARHHKEQHEKGQA